MVDSSSPIEINIQLGDILELFAPENNNLNEEQFYVKYIDTTKIILLNIKNQETTILNITDGQLDQTITGIELLSRAEFPGYAKQHNLEPGTWIDLYFEEESGGGFIITGLITDLEEDSIKIRTVPSNETIYIDFEYKGIPETLPIEKIVIREEPTVSTEVTKLSSPTSTSQEQTIITDVFPEGIPITDVRKQLQEDLLEGDLIQLGEDLDEITVLVDVPEDEKRYSMEKQTNDLLDELLSEIPNYKRTNKVLNNVHAMIERFVQLRNEYSIFDSNGNASMPEHILDTDKPIIQVISDFNKHFEWFLPVSNNRKKLYELDQSDLEVDDDVIDILVLGQQLNAEKEDIEKYFRGNLPADENKYVHLFKQLNKFVTPFINPVQIDHSITSQHVNANMLSVVNNLGNFDSIVAYSYGNAKDEVVTIDTKRFLFETYTTGLTYLKDQLLHKLTASDTMTIRSILTLGIPALSFSRINLPTTSILKRSELNTLDFFYWTTLNKETTAQQLTIDISTEPHKLSKKKFLGNEITDESIDLDSDAGYMTDMTDMTDITGTERVQNFQKTFFSGIREYILDEHFYTEGNTSDKETYKKFLDKVIPTNQEIFNILKKYISNTLSLHSVINFLEIFNIYSRDVTFTLYEKINQFVEQNIISYKNIFATNYRVYGKLSAKKEPILFLNNWLKILATHKDLNTVVTTAYGFSSEQSYSDTEIFNRIMKIDYAKLFTIALLRIDLDLHTTGLIDEFVAKYELALIERDTQQTCKIISKKYTSIDELEADNDKQIYYDIEFDKTKYSLLKKYKKDPEISKEEYKEFLEDKLVRDHQLLPQAAEREAIALILGKRSVEPDDYAILTVINLETQTQIAEYFIRKDEKWIKDNIENVVIKDNKLFCNLQEQCINQGDECLSLKNAEARINENTLKAIYEEFNKTYGEKEDNLREHIDELLGQSIIRIRYLKRFEVAEFYKYNKKKEKIGDSLIDGEETVLLTSPYEKLRGLILGQTDFIKRQNDIQKFVILFTRKAYEIEDQYWLYCLKTGIKLLPTFLSHLANTYISGGGYLYELDIIANDQGTISDDGDAYVDKYSGYFIKKISFDTEEGFTEAGFKLKTREKLEQDLGDAVLEQFDQKTKGPIINEETKKIINIIAAITNPSSMDINLSGVKEFIIRNVLAIYNKAIPSKQKYEKMLKQQKEGKKVATYQEVIDSSLLILTFTFIVIAIQISIPSIKSHKTFPGCIKSFNAYPVYNDDMSAITYIACIARKMRSGTPPWNSIRSFKEEHLVKKIQETITAYKIVKIPDVRAKIIEKKNYKKTEKPESKVDILTEKFYGFYPPLTDFKVTALPLIVGFNDILIKHLKSGNPAQQDQILTIKSKIIVYGLSIQEKIQKIIDKKVPLITTKSDVPFIQNACCNEISTNVHEYFTNLDRSITAANDIVREYSNILYDIDSLSRAPLFYDPRNTKFKYPEISTYFSEDTIYRAFIVFCKSKELALSEELRRVCNIDSGESFVEETSEERIIRLKEEGINYDDNLLQKLLTLVNLKNSIDIDLTIKEPTSVQLLINILERLRDDEKRQTIPLEFINRFNTLLDRYSIKQGDTESSELRDFKNYLGRQNEQLTENIKRFIKSNLGLSANKFKKFVECFDNITDLLEVGDNISVSSNDETTYKMMYFIKNVVHNIINVFPNIIINKIDYSTINIPKHWKLSQKHNTDIRDIIGIYYKNLKQFYNNQELKVILEKIQIKCKNIEKLLLVTPFFATLKNGNNDIASIFDQRLTNLLYKFYLLLILDTYIKSIVDITPIYETVLSMEDEFGEPKETDEVDEKYQASKTKEVKKAEEEKVELSYIEQATIAGAQKEIATQLSTYLVTIIEMSCEDKAVVDYNKETILSKNLTSKEKEKDEITEYLKNLTDEERAVENIFKQHKLEKWSAGLQKGLTQYVQENYDEEREAAEQQLIKEREIAQKTGVNEYNKDIYAYEFDDNAALAEEIDREVNSLTEYQGEEDDPSYDNDPDDYESY